MKENFKAKHFKEKEVQIPASDDELLKSLENQRHVLHTKEEAYAEEKLISDLEGQRDFGKTQWEYWLISIIAFCWSAYHIYVAIFPINGVFVRSVHLAFAVFLAFLIYPMRKTLKNKMKFQWYDYVLAIIASIGALYVYIDYTGLSNRPGAYIDRDLVFAVVTTIILLEASRRALGMALSVIATVFLLYDYFGPYMPELIAHKGASIAKLSGQMYLTTEGIFGVPLGVSAGFVFLFVLFQIIITFTEDSKHKQETNGQLYFSLVA